jgi:hypothetical protein
MCYKCDGSKTGLVKESFKNRILNLEFSTIHFKRLEVSLENFRECLYCFRRNVGMFYNLNYTIGFKRVVKYH